MGSHNVHAKREEKKKKKQGQSGQAPTLLGKPTFVLPTVIKRDRDNS